MIMRRKSIFEILKEAEEDENTSDTAQADTNQAEEESPSPEESNEDAADTGEDDEYGGDDEFDIDADLNEEDVGGEDNDTGASDTDASSSSSSGEMSDEEPVQANTDIFASLTKEEQQVKISELKKLFANLYSSTDDVLDKIGNLNTDDSNIHVINRISMTVYNLRKYIAEYLSNSFPYKSYIENDITFNRFLSILNSVSSVIEDIAKFNNKK